MIRGWIIGFRGVLTVVVCLGLTSVCTANSGHYGGRGSAVFPLQSVDVQMVRERVEINASAFGMHWGPPGWRVRCVFQFLNTGTETLDVPMGFPIQGSVRANPDPKGTTSDGKKPPVKVLRDFHVWVDEAPIATAVAADGEGTYPRGLHTWRVHFAPGQTHEVVVTYFLSGSRTNDGFQYLRYILKTGATWKGVIEEAVIQVRFKDRASLPLKENRLNLPCKKGGDPECLLPGLKISGGDSPNRESVFTWRFENLKPEHDLFLVFSAAAYDRYFLRQNLVDGEWGEARGMSGDERKDLMWALTGKSMSGNSIDHFLQTQSWYFINPDFDRDEAIKALHESERAFLMHGEK